MDKRYFHYTSLKCLYSIISNSELWFANLKNSNDPNEFSLSCEEYNNYIEKLNINPYHGYPMILENNNVLKFPYGISFTTLNDNLSQWERYGDGLKGVAIEFDIDFLQSYLDEKFNFKFEFGSIKYDEAEKIEFIKNKVNEINDVPNYIYKLHWPIYAIYFIMHFAQARALFKSQSFCAENEYRLFFDPKEYEFYHNTILQFKEVNGNSVEESIRDYNYNKEIIHFLEQNKKFALMRNGINSYLPLNLNLFGKEKGSLIKQIILGPKCTQSIEELKDFLLSNGYDTNISKSEIQIL